MIYYNLSRWVLKAFALFAVGIFLFSAIARANELQIIDVRKNIPLSDEEPSYRDLYLNGGQDKGFTKGQIYQVMRRSQVRDASGAQSYGEILIPVGEIKVIGVYERISVARELKNYSRDEYPILNVFGTMAGDRIELKK